MDYPDHRPLTRAGKVEIGASLHAVALLPDVWTKGLASGKDELSRTRLRRNIQRDQRLRRTHRRISF